MSQATELSIGIWGLGAVGVGLAATVAHGGADTSLLGRARGTLDAIRRHGIQREGLFGQVHVAPERVRLLESPRALCEAPPDFLLICVKAFASPDVARALEPYAATLAPHTQLVLCQNGWGNEIPFLRFWPAERLFHARVITGFDRRSPAAVEVTAHAAPIAIGRLRGQAPESLEKLARCMTAGGIPCETAPEMASVLWAKMLYNCALNPIGALTHRRYGELAADPATREVMDRVIEEVFDTLGRAGQRVPWPDADAYREHFYAQLIPPTAAHRSSMLQDLQAGKETEIEALCGAVERLAAASGRSTPTVSALATLVRAAQQT